jgi:hypothetical protein
MSLSTLSPAASAPVEQAANDTERTRVLRLVAVFLLNLLLFVAVQVVTDNFLAYSTRFPGWLLWSVGTSGLRTMAVCSGMLTVLAIRRPWFGWLLAMLIATLHAYLYAFTPWFHDPLFFSHNLDVYVGGEAIYIWLFAFGAHAVTRLARLGLPVAIDLHARPPARRERRFQVSDLLYATAVVAVYLGCISAMPLNEEPFTPHLGITLSVFFMASVSGTILWALSHEQLRQAPWWWVVPWAALFPTLGELLINACVFLGDNPYYWIEARVAETIGCIGIATFNGLLLRGLGFRWARAVNMRRSREQQ